MPLGDPSDTKEDAHAFTACEAPSDAAVTPGPELLSGEIQPLQYPATVPCSGGWGWHAVLGLFLLGLCAGATKCFCTG